MLDEGGSGLTVEAEPGDAGRRRCRGPEQNLVARALAACGRRAGGPPDQADPARAAAWAAARPTRRPSCAGPAATDPAVAARLGADVPFCVVGGRARVEGVGERVTPLPVRAPRLPAAPAALRRRHRGRSTGPGTRSPAHEGPNALAAAALAVEPRLAVWRDALGELAGTRAGAGRERVDLVRRGRAGRGRHRGRGRRCRWGRSRRRLVRGPHRPGGLGRGLTGSARAGLGRYLPARRCQRVAFSIFLCFFLRIRLRRFLISDPMSCGRLAVPGLDCQVGPGRRGGRHGLRDRRGSTTCSWPCRRDARREAEAFYCGRARARAACPSPRRWRRAAAAGSGTATWRCTSAWRRTSGPPARPTRPSSSTTCRPSQAALRGGRACGAARTPTREPGRGAYVDDPFGNRIELIAD